MLTRDLVLFTVRKGRIYPRFLDRKPPVLSSVVEGLMGIYRSAKGTPLQSVEEAMLAEGTRLNRPKVAKGLIKLLADTLTVEDPGEAAMTRRAMVFQAAMDVLGSDKGPGDVDAYAEGLAKRVGSSVEELRHELYADLPQRRQVTGVEELTADGLMNRYDLAVAQGLVMYSQRLVLSFPEMDRPEVRRLLRFMRFCRLVSQIDRTAGACRLTVEGPAAIFEGSKGYGLQLASFLAVVPTLPQWSLEAEVHWPRRAPAKLLLSHKDPLKPRVSGGAGHVPESVKEVVSQVDVPGWSVDLFPPPVAMGATGWAVPDFALVPEGGEPVVVELFHRFHRGAFERRMDELSLFPNPRFRVGVDRALLKDSELAERAEAHPQVFTFRNFPSRRIIQGLMSSADDSAEVRCEIQGQ